MDVIQSQIGNVSFPFKFPKIVNWGGFYDMCNSLSTLNNDLTIVHAPTGTGKTVMVSIILAYMCKRENIKGNIAMPFRISVTSIYSYLDQYSKIVNSELGFNYLSFRYCIKDYSSGPKSSPCTLYTVGFLLEKIISILKNEEEYQLFKTSKHVFFIDEAHDPSWQTHLLLNLISYFIRVEKIYIKVIIASATLNPKHISSIFKRRDINIYEYQDNSEVNKELVNYREIEYVKPIEIVENAFDLNLRIINFGFENCISRYIQDIFDPVSFDDSTKKNILVILPGYSAIEMLESVIKKSREFQRNSSRIKIYYLHSVIPKDELEFAINDDTPNCKIFLSTNIVENAITINNLDYLIDYSYRVHQICDENMCITKYIKLASKSNIIQAQGRVGRQGKVGHCKILVPNDIYNKLTTYPIPEVYESPIFYQLVKLYPVYHKPDIIKTILHDIPNIESKISTDTQFLEYHNILINKGTGQDPQYYVTRLGNDVNEMKMSILPSVFVLKSMNYLISKKITNPDPYYTAIIIACIVDTMECIFERPRHMEFKSKKEHAEELDAKIKDFMEDDTILTTINVIINYFNRKDIEATYTIGRWCFENGINIKSFIELLKQINEVENKIKYIFNIKKLKIPQDISNVKDSIELIKPLMKQVFYKQIYKYSTESRSFTNIYFDDKKMWFYAKYNKKSFENDSEIICFKSVNNRIRTFISL